MRPFVSSKNLDKIESLEYSLNDAQEKYDNIVPRLIDYYFETKGYKFSHIGNPKPKEVYLRPNWEPDDAKLYDIHKVISLFDDSNLHTLVFSKKDRSALYAGDKRIYKKRKRGWTGK